jgi:surface protein
MSNQNQALNDYKDISEWDTTLVTDMSQLFDASRNELAANFNSDIENWNTANVTNMYAMFKGATSFNNNLNWNVKLVENTSSMFENATQFNGDITSWEVNNVTNMSSMFKNASSFNIAIKSWGTTTSNVTNMNNMFENATSFNQPLNPDPSWDLGNVTSTASMFKGATTFNQNLNSWDVENIVNMSSMFEGATQFGGNIKDWNVTNVTTMNSMFKSATSFNTDISPWNVKNVTDFTSMFEGAISFAQIEVKRWRVDPIPGVSPPPPSDNLNDMFKGATLTHSYFSEPTPDSNEFNQAFKPITRGELDIAINEWIVNNSIAINNYGDINTWDITLIQDLSGLFLNKSTFNSNINGWIVGDVTDMSNMFKGATSFNYSLNNWDTTNVVDMNSMFQDATTFNGNISNWDVQLVENMSSMFKNASSFKGDLSSWKPATCQNFSSMFENATQFNSDISNWTTSTSTSMASMFKNAVLFNQNIAEWDVDTVSDMSSMFQGATTFDQNISRWIVTNVTTMKNMFDNASNFSYVDIRNWNLDSMSNASNPGPLDNMFLGSQQPNIRDYFDTPTPLKIQFSYYRRNKVPCFRHGSKILAFHNGKEQYIPVEQLKKGMLIKTYKSGYIPIYKVGSRVFENPIHDQRIKDRLYCLSPSMYPSLDENLYLTGCHSVLLDKLTDHQLKLTVETMGEKYITEGKPRLWTMNDERAIPYQLFEDTNVWHFALEHDDNTMNYGVYANGLLVESTSKVRMDSYF